jgi:hypothetical protein
MKNEFCSLTKKGSEMELNVKLVATFSVVPVATSLSLISKQMIFNTFNAISATTNTMLFLLVLNAKNIILNQLILVWIN